RDDLLRAPAHVHPLGVVGDDGDVLGVREEPGHGAAEGGPAINDHLGDLTGERRQHSLIGSDRVGPAARSGTRLGEQGQPGGLGESRRLRPRTISGDDDARAAQVDLARARAHPAYPHPRAEGDGGLVLAAAIAGDEGLTEGDVHVDRTGRPEAPVAWARTRAAWLPIAARVLPAGISTAGMCGPNMCS